MSAGLDMNSSVDPQIQSKFFFAPAEIRRAVYVHLVPNQIHLFLREKGLRLSACVRRDKDGHPDCDERRSNEANIISDGYADPICALRLRSLWGSHWRCEESAIRMGRKSCEMKCNIDAMALFVVCKRMCIDVAGIMADTIAFQINDLDALGFLVAQSRVLKPARAPSVTLSDFILPSLKELHIALRLPLSTFEALENASDSTDSTSLSSDDSISAWTGLRPAVKRLSKLRRLRISLDHTEHCSWSMVNERIALSPLLPLSNDPNLDISIDLPKLHPKWESPDRHFNEDRPPLIIHRRHRQRYHGVESNDGSIRVEYAPDFPILYELAGIVDMTIESGIMVYEHNRDKHYCITMERVEEIERGIWKRGGNPKREYLDVDPSAW